MYLLHHVCFFFFFFNDTATTEIYTLSLHDALPIFEILSEHIHDQRFIRLMRALLDAGYMEDWRWNQTLSGVPQGGIVRSEEHTSELQSRSDLVCRLLLEKKKRL